MQNLLYLCGLGNPGKEYLSNRHNVGYLCLDYLKERFNTSSWKSFAGKVEFSRGSIIGGDIILIKPLEFMNNSGKSLKAFVDYYTIDLSNLVVIYDDVDIDFGTIRIRKNGSAGSHNGMRDIISAFKTQDIPRIRIGIGPKPAEFDLKDFVLSDFSLGERRKLKDIFEYIASFIPLIFERGLDYLISKYNTRL